MSKPSTIVEIKEFSFSLADLPRPGKRAKARIFCEICRRHHHLHWGEMRNAITRKGADSLQAIINAYGWKYCLRPSDRFLMLDRALSNLVNALESMHPDVFVIDASKRGRDSFQLKLQTPIATYLDEGGFDDWIELVRRDIQAIQEFRCLFCHAQLPWRPSNAVETCLSCRARFGSIQRLLEQVSAMDPRVAWLALADGDRFAREDAAHGLWWWQQTPSTDTDLLDALATISGPDRTPATGPVPRLIDTEGDRAEPIWPECRFCRYAAPPHQASSDHVTCVYPLLGETCERLLNERGVDLDLDSVEPRWDDEDARLRHALLRRAWSALPSGESLEALAGERIYFGPICRQFEIDPNHIELDGRPYAVQGEIEARFGVVDPERLRRERARREAEARWREAEESLRERMRRPETAAWLRTRITALNVTGPDARALVELLRATLPPDLLRDEDVICARLRAAGLLNVSTSAARTIDRLLKQAP
jgi:hypothetical protein